MLSLAVGDFLDHAGATPMFGLDSQSIVERATASGRESRVPTLSASIWRGALGFTVVSLGGFAPWVLAGRWFYRNVGETGLYIACAIMFIGLSGWLLHRLIIGPGSLVRFYQLFGLAFVAYAVLWTIAWMTLGGNKGGVAGALVGTTVMGVIFVAGFGAWKALLKVVVVLFVANALGYFLGGWAYQAVGMLKEGNSLWIVLGTTTRSAMAKLAWGVFYGLGFGAGIGHAFHACQADARKLLLAKRETPIS